MICQLLICPANDPTGTPVETWTDDDILDLRLEISLNDLGRNTVRIPRHTWEGSALDATQSYYVRVNVPYIDNDDPFWGFWLIGGDFILVSPDERGGEDVTIGGPGPAWVLTKAVLNFEEWTDHTGTYVQEGTWYWANKNYGQILTDLINEDAASDHPALDFMEAPGWNNTNDVDGNPWEDFPGIFSASVGDNYLTVIRELQKADNLDVWVSPKLNIRAYVSYGRDLTGSAYGAGVVRFVGSSVTPDEPHNIIGELTRHKDGGKSFTHVLVTGNERREEGRVIEGSSIHRWAVDPDWSSGDEIHQGFMTYETSNTDILERAGLRLIRRSKDRSGRMVSCEVMPGQDEANGLYLPGQPGTDKGDYWIGDQVTFKTGAGDDFDLNNRDLTIAKIKLQLDTAADDTNALSKERSWRTFIETGDDVAPSASASSSANPTERHCRCPQPGDPGDPGTPPTAPTEDFRWSFDDRGGTAFANTYADTTVLHGWTQAFWEDGPGSAWHDDYDEHISWSEAGAITDYIPVTAGVVYTFEADMSQRQSDSNVYLRVKWYTAGGTLLQTDYVAGPGIAVAVKTNYSTTVTAPATATQIRLQVDAANGEFGAADNIVMSHGGSGGTPATPGDDPVGQVGGSGQGVYAENDHFIPVGSILEHLHITDGGPYHDADQIAIDDAGALFTATDVEAALQELAAAAGVTDHGVLTGLTDDDHTQYVLRSILTAKGDLFVRNASGAITRIPVGSDDQILSADSTQTTGLIWTDPPEAGGSGTGIGEILISDTPSTPLIFADLLQNEAQTDLLYADPEEGGGGGGVTDHGALTGLADFDHDQYVRGESGKSVYMLGAVVRKTAGSWLLLDDAGHTPLGFSSISSDSTKVLLTPTNAWSTVVSAVAVIDETWGALYDVGVRVASGNVELYIFDKDGAAVNPSSVADSANGNFWVLGIMEV